MSFNVKPDTFRFQNKYIHIHKLWLMVCFVVVKCCVFVFFFVCRVASGEVVIVIKVKASLSCQKIIIITQAQLLL